MKSIVVCVEYHDLLAITLPLNARHFEKTVVVTSPTDKKTQEVASSVPNVEVFTTDAFYKFGALFNKGLALELGFDVLGKDGWIVVWDADTLFPDSIEIPGRCIGNLYGARRRIALNLWDFSFDNQKLLAMGLYPETGEIPGYFQMFHATDPALKGRNYWYPVDWKHAGGCDSYFQMKWTPERKKNTDFYVLHYGQPGGNWTGRSSAFLDGTMPEKWGERLMRQNEIFMHRTKSGITDVEKITKDDL